MVKEVALTGILKSLSIHASHKKEEEGRIIEIRYLVGQGKMSFGDCEFRPRNLVLFVLKKATFLLSSWNAVLVCSWYHYAFCSAGLDWGQVTVFLKPLHSLPDRVMSKEQAFLFSESGVHLEAKCAIGTLTWTSQESNFLISYSITISQIRTTNNKHAGLGEREIQYCVNEFRHKKWVEFGMNAASLILM